MPRGTPPGPKGAPAPPLRVWAAVAGVILVSIAFSIPPFLSNRAAVEREFDRACAQRIEAFAARCEAGGKGAPRIIAVGSSLLACATLFDERLEDLSRREGPGDLRFLRLARGQSDFDHFLPVMDRIIAARPDVLLIEADLLYYRWKSHDMASSLNEYAEYFLKLLIRGVRRLGGIGDTGGDDPLLMGAMADHHVQLTSREFRIYQSVMKLREARGPLPPGGAIEAMLKRAQKQGIWIVILDFPRTRQAEEAVPPPQLRKVRAVHEQLRRELKLPILKYPGRFPSDRFRDYSHLDLAGAEIYSRWLVAETMKMFDGKGGR